MENNSVFGNFGNVMSDDRKELRIGDTVTIDDAPRKNNYVLLKDGDYQFAVTAVDVEDFKGSAKLPPCQCIKLTLDVDGGEQGQGRCYTRLYVCNVESQLRRLKSFYRSCGIIDKTANNFSITVDVVGAVGNAHFSQHTYNNKTSLNLAWFLD